MALSVAVAAGAAGAASLAAASCHRMSAGLLSLMGEHITFGIHPEDVGDFLRREGLTLREVADAAELERRYIGDDRRVYPDAYLLSAQVR